MEAVYWLGAYVLTALPAFITLEMFLATFFPSTFTHLVTPKSVVIFNLAIWLFWTLWTAFVTFLYALYSILRPDSQFISYRSITTPSVTVRETSIEINTAILNVFISVVALILVSTGCVLIGVKLKLVQRQKKRLMISRETTSMKKTFTLLSVCLILAVLNACYFIISFTSQNLSSMVLLLEAKVFLDMYWTFL
ncbi:hypothetical protein BgiBS90_021296 [Biomphalaria glabrata]|nr:hypothetical protein BgiBS90_021296 [Biomphalaria glabrata]